MLMISWFKKHFIPHNKNDHRPHFLRGESVRRIIGIVLLVELIAFILPTINFVGLVNNFNLSAVLPAVLNSLTNQERNQNKLKELSVNPLLSKAAQLKAEDMASKGYFAHTSPEGKTPWYWFDKVGYSYDYAGENLAINFSDSKDVTEAWMNSKTHRLNIEGTKYKEMGTGIAVGKYEGKETIFIVQLYGNPLSQPVNVGQSAPVSPTTGGKLSQNVLGESTSQIVPEKKPTFFEETLASPRHATNTILYIIAGIMLLVLILNISIKFKIQHLNLITNGIVVIAVIFGFYIANIYISNNKLSVATTFMSFNSEHQ